MIPHKPSHSTVDRELQQRFVDGDNDAFGVLVQPHLSALRGTALRVLTNDADADDCVGEALVLAMNRRHQFEVGRPIRPWLVRIVRNQALSRMRSPWWKRVVRVGEDGVPFDDPNTLPQEKRDRDVKIRQALMEMPPSSREVLAMYHLHGMTYVELHEETGVSVSALKQRVRRGTILLRDKLTELFPEMEPNSAKPE